MFGAVLFKVKPGKLEDWRAWCHELMVRKTEALETLREEREIFEGGFDFSLDGTSYVILYGYNEEPLLPATDRDINRRHKRMKMECLDFIGRPEGLGQGYFLCHWDQLYNR